MRQFDLRSTSGRADFAHTLDHSCRVLTRSLVKCTLLVYESLLINYDVDTGNGLNDADSNADADGTT